ncbi:unnamed protein product, partial [marine sediment metagenome]
WEQVAGFDLKQRYGLGPRNVTVYLDELGFIE